jgi:hypothetical protein
VNLTQFFDASIKLQKYGYKIHSIEQNTDGKYYFIRFAYADVCSGLAFGGVQYEIQFYNGSTQPIFVYKMVVRKLKLEFEPSQEVSNIDEAVDFIIADIQKLEDQLKEEERQKVLAKLTQRERELLGV